MRSTPIAGTRFDAAFPAASGYYDGSKREAVEEIVILTTGWPADDGEDMVPVFETPFGIIAKRRTIRLAS